MKTPLWLSEHIYDLFHSQNKTSWVATGVSIDTRTLCPGDLFVAWKGPHWDGHDFLQEAFQKGAVAALVQDSVSSAELPLVVVKDTLSARQCLAIKARERFQGKILALTGSVGKTTVNAGLHHALSALYPSIFSSGNYNNHIGVPLSLARLPQHAVYGLLEVGMNHAGEIQALVPFIQPHVGMITNVSNQHIGHFSSVQDIVKAKCELFSFPLQVNGRGILYHDSPHYKAMVDLCPVTPSWLTFGVHPKASLRLESTEAQHALTRVHMTFLGTPFSYLLPLNHDSWILNSMAILSGVFALTESMDDVLKAAGSLETFLPLKGRGQRLDCHGIGVIDESYNAAPAAMMAALQNFSRQSCLGKKYILLGDMGELGTESAALHAELRDPLLQSGADGIWLCGPEFYPTFSSLPADLALGHANEVKELIPSLLKILKQGDLILIKGSRAMALERAIHALA